MILFTSDACTKNRDFYSTLLFGVWGKKIREPKKNIGNDPVLFPASGRLVWEGAPAWNSSAPDLLLFSPSSQSRQSLLPPAFLDVPYPPTPGHGGSAG